MKTALRWLRDQLSFLRHFRRPAFISVPSLQSVFTHIYHRNMWQDPQSVSGPGSSVEATTDLRAALPELIRRLGIRTLLDVPCGDRRWTREMDLELDLYIGADIVPELVAANIAQTASHPRPHQFLHLDLTRDPLPRADLVLCRDCLVHFSLAQALQALDNIRASGARYLLATTFPQLPANREIPSGLWRPLNLQLPPFDLPPPLEHLPERAAGKSLALWDLHRLHSA